MGPQWRTLLGESDNGFMNAFELHFGLGSDAVMDSVEIFWPSGEHDLFADVAADVRFWALEAKPQTQLRRKKEGGPDLAVIPRKNGGRTWRSNRVLWASVLLGLAAGLYVTRRSR